MFGSNSRQSDVSAASLGVWISPNYGQAYPELKKRLFEIYRDKVSKLDFVPSGWFALVQKLQDQHPLDLVRIAPSQMQNGSPIENMPEWIQQTPRTSNAWQSLFNAENAATVDFAQQQQSKGKAELDRLYANAQFWNTAYLVGKATGVVGAQAVVQGVKDKIVENELNIKVVGTVIGILAALWVLTPYVLQMMKGK